MQRLLQRALADDERGYGNRAIAISSDAANHLVDVAGGDARSLLNALELAVESSEPDGDGVIQINLAIAEESIQQRAVLTTSTAMPTTTPSAPSSNRCGAPMPMQRCSGWHAWWKPVKTPASFFGGC